LIQDFCIQKPKIAILGLNPHAGDGGAIGNEEIEIIEPAIKELFDEGILAFGHIQQTVSSNQKNTAVLMRFWQCIMTKD
jgi:4-hydroxy-L-threonine phosphate dehydrogenase PdxA